LSWHNERGSGRRNGDATPEHPRFAREQTERWCEACQDFLSWEREHIIKAEPTEQEKRFHRQTLKWLLRSTRLFHASTDDPDFTDRKMVDMLEGTVLKLKSSWSTIYEPMPEGEAKKLLSEVFPGSEKFLAEVFPEK
jgi:hypothetical protein